MSHRVFGWQGKLVALGLLMALVMLSGANCMNELLPGVGQDTDTGHGNSGNNGNNGGNPIIPPGGATTGAATILVSSPSATLTMAPGGVVQISWSYTDPSAQAQITVFYDTDRTAGNGFQALNVINNSTQGAPSFYNWNTIGLAPGTYFVGAQIDDGTHPAATSYAVGSVVITTGTAARSQSLGDIGKSFNGCVFEGMSFAGRLGDVMAGRFDVLSATGSPDGGGDFVLVAPRADSHYVEDPEVGEAYVFFGWNGQTTGRSSGWYKGAHFNVNQVGSDPDVPGFIVVGPAYVTKSMGITSVQALADLDGDTGAELMFGTPQLINGRYDAQDYDPESPVGYLNAPFAYPPAPTPQQQPDWHDWYGGFVWSSGYTTILASTTPGLYVPSTGTGHGLGGVIHIDEIGATPDDPTRREFHPRSIRFLESGLRLYPYARLVRWFDFLQNDYLFGMDLGAEDLDGDGTPELLISAPNNLNGAGEVDIGYSSLAWLWTRALPATATCYSWPYMIEGPGGADRIPIWPFGLQDRIRGDELRAPGGKLGNPTGLGDFNDDKLGDISVSTPAWSKSGLLPDAGAAYMVFGRAPFGDHSVGEIKSPVVLNALPGIAIYGTGAGDRVGEKMTGLGRPNYGMVGHPRLRDFNGDGLPDWVITAPGRPRQVKDANGNITETRANAGAVAVVFGGRRLDGEFTWDQIGTDDLPGIVITGSYQGDAFGTFIAQAGDVNGDGSDDLLVAAPGVENPLTGAQDTGAVYVIFGSSSGGAGAGDYQQLRGVVDINTLTANGPARVKVYYGAVPGNKIGPVGSAGDVDNDGFEDILIADPVAAPLGRTGAGQVYLIFGGQY